MAYRSVFKISHDDDNDDMEVKKKNKHKGKKNLAWVKFSHVFLFSGAHLRQD